MTCEEFDRWMDEGMAEAFSALPYAHARTCARCSAALEVERAIEAALRAGELPVSAPGGFASSVMTRVRSIEAAHRQEIMERPSPRWWISLVTDPVAFVPFALALLALALLIWNPAGTLRIGGWIGMHWFTWVTRVDEISLDSRVWAALLATACPFVIWWLWTVGRSVERTLVLHMTRPGGR